MRAGGRFNAGRYAVSRVTGGRFGVATGLSSSIGTWLTTGTISAAAIPWGGPMPANFGIYVEGTATIADNDSASEMILARMSMAADHFFLLRLNSAAVDGAAAQAAVRDPGAPAAATTVTSEAMTLPIGSQEFRAAVWCKDGLVRCALNGVVVENTGVNAILPDMTTADLEIAPIFDGSFTRATLYRIDVSDQQLVDMTTLPAIAPEASNAPAVSPTGAQQVATLLTASAGVWTGRPTPSIAGQWYRDADEIPGATASTYTLSVADIGAAITYVETAENAGGTVSSTSNAIAALAAQTAPVNAQAPTVAPTGTQTAGTTLTASAGAWTGNPTPDVTGQWYRGASPIVGETGATYVLAEADAGESITYVETAENVVDTVTAASNIVTGATAQTAPAQMSAPTVTASSDTAISVDRAAAPSDGGSAITSYDLRWSTDEATWTTIAGIADPEAVTGLTAETLYYAQTRAVNAVGAGAWSTSGSATTDAAPDVTAPTLQSSVPTDNATDVVVGSDIVLTFDEPVVAGLGAFRIYDVTNATSFETYGASGGNSGAGGTVGIVGAVVTLTVGNTMDPSTEYEVRWTADAVQDAAGNAVAENAGDGSVTFTTAAGGGGYAPNWVEFTPGANYPNFPGTAYQSGTFAIRIESPNDPSGYDSLLSIGLTGPTANFLSHQGWSGLLCTRVPGGQTQITGDPNDPVAVLLTVDRAGGLTGGATAILQIKVGTGAVQTFTTTAAVEDAFGAPIFSDGYLAGYLFAGGVVNENHADFFDATTGDMLETPAINTAATYYFPGDYTAAEWNTGAHLGTAAAITIFGTIVDRP